VSAPAYRLISERAELTGALGQWSESATLALDTEFVFERTFLPRPGLAQLASGGQVLLVDLVALPDLALLAQRLASESALKIFHAGGADVEILTRLTGVAPRRVFDTQIGAAFAGLGSGLSYGALIATLLGIELEKSETRTDWTARPLRSEQLRYAAEDVAHLEAAAEDLRRRLAALGRLSWAEEESATVLEEGREESTPETAWMRVRGLGRLPPAGRGVARALAAWREREARRLDLARPFLLRDETLLALARRDALDREDLPRLPGYDRRRHERHAEAWLAAHAAARRQPLSAGEDQDAPPSRRDWRELEKLSKEIAARVERRAAELELPPELLLSRRLRQRLLSDWDGAQPLGERLTGFRRELLGPLLDGMSA